MHEDFKFALDKHSTAAKTFSALSPSEIESLAGRVPERLIEIFVLFGRFTLIDGWVHCCHPDDLKSILDIILGDDPQLRPEETAAYAYTAFGTIYFYNQEYGCGYVNLPRGTLICTGLTKDKVKFPENPVFSPFVRPFNEFTPDGTALFKPALAAHGELDWGQIYGLVPALTLGGEMQVKNLKKMDGVVHLNILAELQPVSLFDIQVGAFESSMIREIG